MANRTSALVGTLLLALLSPLVGLLLAEALAFAAGVEPDSLDKKWMYRMQTRRCRTDWWPARSLCTGNDLAHPGRKLVVVLGGSSVLGYPVGSTIPFAVHLQRLLDRHERGVWRAVNRGFACKDSIFVRECARHALEAGASVLVVYAGHNDFANWGSWDPASRIWKEELLWLYDLEALLGRTRTFSLLSRLLRPESDWHPRPALQPPPEVADESKRVILAKFTEDIGEVLALAERHGAVVILVTVVSNLHEFPVRRQEWDTGTARLARRPDLAPWGERFERGIELYRAERFEEALVVFEQARDLQLHGRAHTDLNDRVRELADAHPHAYLVDFEKELRAVGVRDGIGCNFFGDETYCDQFHPNTRTQRMIARAVFLEMQELDSRPSASR
jgi:hypothetical protein